LKETILAYLNFLEYDLEIERKEAFESKVESVPKATDYYASLKDLELGVFEKMQVRLFENGGAHIWLWTECTPLEQFERLTKLLVELYGPDCNGMGYPFEAEKEISIIDHYYSRYWEFDRNHQCFDENQQAENEYYYSILLSWNSARIELELLNFDTLLEKNKRRITWL
jgi:hypothetical protein